MHRPRVPPTCARESNDLRETLLPERSLLSSLLCGLLPRTMSKGAEDTSPGCRRLYAGLDTPRPRHPPGPSATDSRASDYKDDRSLFGRGHERVPPPRLLPASPPLITIL